MAVVCKLLKMYCNVLLFFGGVFWLKKKKKSFYTQHSMVASSDKIVKIGKVGKIEQLVIHDDQIKASL